MRSTLDLFFIPRRNWYLNMIKKDQWVMQTVSSLVHVPEHVLKRVIYWSFWIWYIWLFYYGHLYFRIILIPFFLQIDIRDDLRPIKLNLASLFNVLRVSLSFKIVWILGNIEIASQFILLPHPMKMLYIDWEVIEKTLYVTNFK